jgi:hypothetical protein
MRPLLSICIPTYNRADLLDYCLTNLARFNDCGKPFEIVISDNGSTDRTTEVIEAHRSRFPVLRAYRFPENKGPYANWLNLKRKAEGELVVYVADDDSLIVDGLLHHVETMEKQTDLVAVYADWVAWDDQAEREIHRYFDGLTEAVSFGPDAPLDLVNFMLKRFYPPEVGVYRRAALLRAHDFTNRTMPYYTRMYHLSRLGRVAFDPLPFYREQRVLKERFRRTGWLNMELQLHMIGDELRRALESIVLMAVQDAGAASLPPDQMAGVRNSIDRILHSRLGLEAERACARKDWILAVDLKRRLALWHGPGSAEQMHADVLKFVVQAALQAVQTAFQSISGCPGISLRGFETGKAAEFFTRFFPDTPLLAADVPPSRGEAVPLIVHRDMQTLAQDTTIEDASRVMVLAQQMDLYRISRAKIDLKGF